MSQIDTGGPAYPKAGQDFITARDGERHHPAEYGLGGNDGMTLLDYFAGEAPALSGHGTLDEQSSLSGLPLPSPGIGNARSESTWAAWRLEADARWAYRWAAARLAEKRRLEKGH